jgi:hypothetical protein
MIRMKADTTVGFMSPSYDEEVAIVSPGGEEFVTGYLGCLIQALP